MFPTLIIDAKACKNTILDRRLKWTALTYKRGTDPEPKLLEVRHMSRPYIYIYINLKTLAHKTPFQNRRFWTCVASTWVRRPPTFPTRILKKVRRHDVIEGSRGRGTLLRRRGPLTHDIQFMWLVKKMKTVQVHFTLDLKGVRDQKSSWLDEKSTWYTTWQQVDSV